MNCRIVVRPGRISKDYVGIMYDVYRLDIPLNKNVFQLKQDGKNLKHVKPLCGMYGGDVFCPRTQKEIDVQFLTGTFWTGN